MTDVCYMMPDLAIAPRRTDKPVDALHLRILSRPDWIEPIVLALRRQALDAGVCDEDRANRLAVALTEAITNAIVHGNLELETGLKERDEGAFRRALDQRTADLDYASRIVDVRFECLPDRCVWTVTDQGAGFDVEAVLARLEADDPTIDLCGRGIPIMRAFVDGIGWDEGGRRIRLTILRDRVDERRAAPRHYCSATIGVDVAGETHRREAIARNLSEDGIAFVTTEPIGPGSHVTVLMDPEHDPNRCARGVVVRCRRVACPYYDVGVHFDHPQPLPDGLAAPAAH
jgi:anti-sigma regulatory factor (Ser/Thr protein kinase)